MQVLTSLQDNTISSVPRLLATAVGAIVLMPWMLRKLAHLHPADVRRFPAAAALEEKRWNCDLKNLLPPWLSWERGSPELLVFAPFLGSSAIAPRIKVGLGGAADCGALSGVRPARIVADSRQDVLARDALGGVDRDC